MCDSPRGLASVGRRPGHPARRPLATTLLVCVVAAVPTLFSCGDRYTCRGSAPSCYSRPTTDCERGDACHIGARCVDVLCATLLTAEDCHSEPSCDLSQAGCTARPSTCAVFGTEDDCEQARGCSWGEGCVGELPSCGVSTEEECTAIPYCSWERASNWG